MSAAPGVVLGGETTNVIKDHHGIVDVMMRRTMTGITIGIIQGAEGPKKVIMVVKMGGMGGGMTYMTLQVVEDLDLMDMMMIMTKKMRLVAAVALVQNHGMNQKRRQWNGLHNLNQLVHPSSLMLVRECFTSPIATFSMTQRRSFIIVIRNSNTFDMRRIRRCFSQLVAEVGIQG